MRFIAAVTGLLALLAIGCVEREDTITVHADGSTTIRAKISGERGDFRAPLAFPSPPIWTILEDVTDTAGVEADARLTRVGEVTIPYGQPMPSTFAAQTGPGYDQALKFPTEVRHWSENGRDYYEFKRTYRARRFGCYNLASSQLWGEDMWDQELEDRVMEKGIFEVSEEDRDSYLEQFGMTFGYMQWRFLWQALAEMRRQGELSDSVRSRIEVAAAGYLEETLSADHLMEILEQNREDLDSVMIQMTEEIRSQLRQLVNAETGPENRAVMSRFINAQDLVLRDYAITEALGAQRFSVELQMPGELLDANGLVDHENPGGVYWEFDGAELHDADIPLYALSVVEHNKVDE